VAISEILHDALVIVRMVFAKTGENDKFYEKE